jgi:hypothetical protein
LSLQTSPASFLSATVSLLLARDFCNIQLWFIGQPITNSNKILITKKSRHPVHLQLRFCSQGISLKLIYIKPLAPLSVECEKIEDRTKKKDSQRENNQNDRVKIKENKIKYYHKNLDKIKDIQNEYNTRNQAKLKEHKKEYYKKNLDKIKETQSKYYQKNRLGKIKEAKQKYYKQIRFENNSNFIPNYSWKTREQSRISIESIATLFQITDLSDWYRISVDQIKQFGGVN